MEPIKFVYVVRKWFRRDFDSVWVVGVYDNQDWAEKKVSESKNDTYNSDYLVFVLNE